MIPGLGAYLLILLGSLLAFVGLGSVWTRRARASLNASCRNEIELRQAAKAAEAREAVLRQAAGEMK